MRRVPALAALLLALLLLAGAAVPVLCANDAPEERRAQTAPSIGCAT